MKSVALSLATVAAVVTLAVGATGAYFTDANTGAITGTVGSVKVDTWGGTGVDSLNFNFVNLMPEEPQTIIGNYQNTGTGNQDIWIVFNNADALHAINDLGTYAEVHMTSNGTPIFDSANLNDGYPCGTPGLNGLPTLCALPSQIKLASNIGPTASGSFGFTFMLDGKFGNGIQGTPFNPYPVDVWTSNGLPYQIVATQVGQAPTN